ncbi:MAG: SRPBCC domain-containing protein [Sandaracinaceae bacterium]
MSGTEGLSVVHEVVIRAPIERVWAEVTKTDEVQKPMFDMRMHCDLVEGAPLRMRSANGKYTGVVGEILAIEPPRRLSFTFRFTLHDDPPCRVTYELEEVEEGTRFRMVSDRLPPDTKSTKQMSEGGQMIVDTLKAVLETGRPPLKTRLLYALFGLMAPFTPARCRSENWP